MLFYVSLTTRLFNTSSATLDPNSDAWPTLGRRLAFPKYFEKYHRNTIGRNNLALELAEWSKRLILIFS